MPTACLGCFAAHFQRQTAFLERHVFPNAEMDNVTRESLIRVISELRGRPGA